MKCPVAVSLLLVVSLTSWTVLSDRLPEQIKSSKYVQKDKLTMQTKHLQHELTELHETVDSLRTDLLETRNLLAQALFRVSEGFSSVELYISHE